MDRKIPSGFKKEASTTRKKKEIQLKKGERQSWIRNVLSIEERLEKEENWEGDTCLRDVHKSAIF